MSLLDDALGDFDALSAEDGAAAEPADVRTLLTFRLGGQVFAADVGWVREVVDMTDIAPLPRAPHGVLGMIDLRNEAIAIVDVAARLGIAAAEGRDTRIIVFVFDGGALDGGSPDRNDDGQAISLGVVADQVLRVCEIGAEAVEPLPETKTGWRSEDIEGLVRTEDGFALLLAVERVLCADAAMPGAFDFG